MKARRIISGIVVVLLTLFLAGFATGIVPLRYYRVYDDGNGEVYSGYVQNGQFVGTVAITYSDGGHYLGGLKDMRFDGAGVYTYPDGKSVSGIFKDGSLVAPAP
jgi:hypothetical protein